MEKEKQILNLNDAISALNSDCVFENHEPFTDYSKIVWNDGSPIVSKEDAEAKMAELQAIEDTRFDTELSDKASGNAKLIALGLSEAEVDAITK